MKTRLRNSGVRLLLAIIFFSGTLHAQEKKSEKALLWKVSGNGLRESSYLFGTYHLLGDKFLSQVPETQQPFAKAKGIVVEMLMDSAKIQTLLLSKGIMYDKKISTLLSPEDFNRVDSVLKALSGYSLKMFDMLKPAQVAVMLTLFQTQTLQAEQLKKYEGVPLDIHFAVDGKKQGKTVTPLETMEQQFDMLLSHYPVEEQARQLVEAVNNITLMGKLSTEMFDQYVQKDIGALLRLMDSMPKDLTGDMDYMLKDRNVNWLKTLPDLMKSGSQFIAVGAGHLPGENGLITLLRKQGYEVTPVTK